MIRVRIILLSLILAQVVQAGPVRHLFADRDTSWSDNTDLPIITISTFPTELTVDGLISLSKSNIPLQLGAFSRRKNAETLAMKLESMLSIPVKVVDANGLFKVMINHSSENSALCYFIPVDFGETEVVRETKIAEILPTPVPVPALTDTLRADPAVVSDTVPTISEVPDTTALIATDNFTPAPAEEVRPLTLRSFFTFDGNSPWQSKFVYEGKSIALVNALIITIVLSIVTMVLLLIAILLNRRRMEKESTLRQYLLEKYQGLIVNYLFGDTTAEQFRPIASDIYRRGVLIDQIIDVSVNLKGDAGAKLNHLYRVLNLDKDSIRRAHSRRWHLKIKGFRELAFMNIKDANPVIYKALNSKNEILRMEAQIALVRLSDDDPFTFLSHLKRPFSLWEQITLHDLMIQHELPVPDFQKWLISANPTVVMFALRMIREFKQKDSEPEVRKALLHRDPKVSMLAVQVAGDLDMRSTLETMKRMYKYQEYNNCLEIVKSMGRMPDLTMMGFLKLVLDKEDDVQLQIEATKAIENMGEEGVAALVKVMKSEYKNYNIIVRHVLDRRIY
jgi:hypothetical protein